MAIAGPKPKPRDQIRHRVPPRAEWVEVPKVRYTDGPDLPATPRSDEGAEPPEPKRPLGRHGRDLWDRTWRRIGMTLPDVDVLLSTCELLDERVPLRVAVMTEGDRWKRNALRDLDRTYMNGLVALEAGRHLMPKEWPDATRHWWSVVSTMPHCALWDAEDWEFAVDTARIAAVFHQGDVRVAAELRRREHQMGTTIDSRRDLRIRYIDPDDAADADEAKVTAMDRYRRMATT